jgi:hypothetical protein
VTKYNGEDGHDYAVIIYNCSHSSTELAKKFLRDLPEIQLPEPYESVKNHLRSIRAMANEKSEDTDNKLNAALVKILTRRQVNDVAKAMMFITKAEKKFKTQSQALEEAFTKFNKSLEELLSTFSNTTEKCVDRDQRHFHIVNKTKLIILLFGPTSLHN